MITGPDIQFLQPAFVHESALLFGKITVHENASIWMNVVARAEHQEIVIGAYTNIQDFVMLHIGDRTPLYIGSHCSITHHCTLHGCTIGDNCLVGINTTIMDGCVIGDNCIIGGHSFLKEGTIIPANSIVMGTPGKVVRTQNNLVKNRINAFMYYKNALAYTQGRHREWARESLGVELQEEIQRLLALAALENP